MCRVKTLNNQLNYMLLTQDRKYSFLYAQYTVYYPTYGGAECDHWGYGIRSVFYKIDQERPTSKIGTSLVSDPATH